MAALHVNVRGLQQHTSELLNRAKYLGQHVIVEKGKGRKPVAILLSVEEYERLTKAS